MSRQLLPLPTDTNQNPINIAWARMMDINNAYDAAGMDAQIHWAATFYDGGNDPTQAVDDSTIGVDIYPIAPKHNADNSVVSSRNVVYMCDHLDDNGAGIGYKFVNAAAVLASFDEHGVVAMQQLINSTVNPA